jgi:hypothetical protein
MPRKLAAAIAALLASVVVVITITPGDDGKPHATITVKTRNQAGQVRNVVAPKVQPVADRGLRDRTEPPAVKRSSNRANPDGPRIAGPVPLASAHQDGCLTRAIPVNYSYRSGVKPSLIVLHYTVSPNVPGWNDVNSIVAFFSRSSTQASSNYVIDNEGHCVLMVPESEKAWAQANYNSATACSIEVINTGSEATYIGPDGGPGQAKLAKVVHDCAARWHIPLRRGAVSGCSVTKAGVVDHATLGSCGGGHFDIGKFRDVDIDKTIRNAGHGSKPISAGQRKRCAELNTFRRHSRAYHRKYHLKPVPPLSAKDHARAKAILAGERRRGVVCKVGPPGKRGTVRRK